MPIAAKFDELWARYEEARELGKLINPDGNRCALVLGAALKNQFKPRKDKRELSFREISQPPKGVRGQPFLDRFYVKAEQLAKRIEEEWGKPQVRVPGPSAIGAIKDTRGIIFIENAWYAGFPMRSKTVDHIDLWNGSRMGAYGHDHCVDIFKKADFVSLWFVYSP